MEASRVNFRFKFLTLPPHLKHPKLASTGASALTSGACSWPCPSCSIPASLTQPAPGLAALTFQNTAHVSVLSCKAFHFFFYSSVTNHPRQFPPYLLFTTSPHSVPLTQNSTPRTRVPPLSPATSLFHFPPFHSRACFLFAPNNLNFSSIQRCKCCRLWSQLLKPPNGQKLHFSQTSLPPPPVSQ